MLDFNTTWQMSTQCFLTQETLCGRAGRAHKVLHQNKRGTPIYIWIYIYTYEDKKNIDYIRINTYIYLVDIINVYTYIYMVVSIFSLTQNHSTRKTGRGALVVPLPSNVERAEILKFPTKTKLFCGIVFSGFEGKHCNPTCVIIYKQTCLEC